MANLCQLIENSNFDGSRMWKTLKQEYYDTLYTKTVDIVEILNKHFVTIGHKLAHAL